jgi:hypothetical protein
VVGFLSTQKRMIARGNLNLIPFHPFKGFFYKVGDVYLGGLGLGVPKLCYPKVSTMHIRGILFLTSSWSLDIPTAKITASTLYDSLPQTTSEIQHVSSLKKKFATFLPSRISQPLSFKKSIKGSKIFSLTVPRHNTKSKSFYIIHINDSWC